MRLLAVYGLLNAGAYCCLLPLWEGWDESYHYGYVQSFSTNFRFPELGRTVLSREVWHSLELTPVSPYWKQLGRGRVSFSDYFELSQSERAALRQQRDSLPPEEKFQPQTDRGNYESGEREHSPDRRNDTDLRRRVIRTAVRSYPRRRCACQGCST